MGGLPHVFVDLGIILILVAGITQFRSPRTARRGNLTEALALALATATILSRSPITGLSIVIPAALLGTLAGWQMAVRTGMVQIPAMVAFQHGMGGVAAMLISLVELTRETSAPLAPVGIASGLLGLVVGAATFSGSMVASGKLAGRLRQTPVVLPAHSGLVLALATAILVMAIFLGWFAWLTLLTTAVLALTAAALGIVFSVRIGGADMPVLISFLNATAGLAASLCGVTIQNRLLIACGATVAASGSILTHVMCRAMNRRLAAVFVGLDAERSPSERTPPESLAPAPAPEEELETSTDAPTPLDRAAEAARGARTVIIVPGYGMALAQAQFEVVQLARRLEELGKTVRFAIHPVAGRMPGHMHVLLAEADVEYDRLQEMDQINPAFKDTDVVLVVGACDVVNPAAIDVQGTPISGMPILMAHEARQIVVCNLDERPGYSGVDNPLYRSPKAVLLLGDARDRVAALRAALA